MLLSRVNSFFFYCWKLSERRFLRKSWFGGQDKLSSSTGQDTFTAWTAFVEVILNFAHEIEMVGCQTFSNPRSKGRACVTKDSYPLRWPNPVFARALPNAIQGAHKDCKKKQTWRCYSNALGICAIFLHNWTQCIDGFSLLLERYVRKGNDAKNPAILSFFFVNERTQLNAAQA